LKIFGPWTIGSHCKETYLKALRAGYSKEFAALTAGSGIALNLHTASPCESCQVHSSEPTLTLACQNPGWQVDWLLSLGCLCLLAPRTKVLFALLTYLFWQLLTLLTL